MSSDLLEIEITEGINLHIISPEPIQYVDLSTQKLTGDLPATNIARIKITDQPETNSKDQSFGQCQLKIGRFDSKKIINNRAMLRII